MNKILKLDSHLMNMIAAGEVVERPAGIVKELVDNSIDANANIIEINVLNGGIDFIEVVDNGDGMSKDDAQMAFMRHATSKIKSSLDLWSIKSLGFRGEALPSIASVSNTTLITNNNKESTIVEVEFGEIKKIAPIAANKGSIVRVSKLFYQTPARLKSLNNPNYEMAIITSNIEKFALAYPQISFKLTNNNKTVFNNQKDASLKDVVYNIYGKDIYENSRQISGSDDDFKVVGVITLPSYSRSNKNHINIFVNDRMIRSYKIVNEIIEAYKPFMFSHRFPIVTLKIYVDYQLVDVNVHPTKWEVKISKEKALLTLINKVISENLSDFMRPPSIKKIDETSEQLAFDSKQFSEVVSDFKVLEEDIKEEFKSIKQTSESDQEKVNIFSQLQLIGQMHGKYILANDSESLYIIDQHAAAERVNYEKIGYKLKNQIIESTPLLILEKIKVLASDLFLIDDFIKASAKIGLTLELFGNDTLVIREIPLYLVDQNLEAFVEMLLNNFKEQNNFEIDYILQDKIASMACKSSIKFNHTLSTVEMLHLINDLGKSIQPYHCPHGRPTLIKIDEKQLIKEFLR